MRYNFFSKDLDKIAKELVGLGMEARRRERELVFSNKIKEKSYLEVRENNVRGKLYTTSASLYLDGGYQTEKNKKLIRCV